MRLRISVGLLVEQLLHRRGLGAFVDARSGGRRRGRSFGAGASCLAAGASARSATASASGSASATSSAAGASAISSCRASPRRRLPARARPCGASSSSACASACSHRHRARPGGSCRLSVRASSSAASPLRAAGRRRLQARRVVGRGLGFGRSGGLAIATRRFGCRGDRSAAALASVARLRRPLGGCGILCSDSCRLGLWPPADSLSASSVPSMRSTVNVVVSSDRKLPGNNKTRASRSGLRLLGVFRVLVGSSDSFQTSARERSSDVPVGPAHGSTPLHAADSMSPRLRVPELPDLAILADAIDAASSPPVRRRDDAPIAGPAWHARGARRIRGPGTDRGYRRGKFLVFNFARDRMIFNPMLTGVSVCRARQPRHGRRSRRCSNSFEAARDAERGRSRPHPMGRHGRAWLPARDARRDALPRRDPNGQDLPDAGGVTRASPAGTSRARTRTTRR